MAAEKSGWARFIEGTGKSHQLFLFNLSTSAYVTSGMTSIQCPSTTRRLSPVEIIKEIAKTGDSVIVGAVQTMCSGPPLLRVFLYGEKQDRLNRIINEYGYDPKKAEADLNKIDRGRANYHKFYTGLPWKDISNYDICLNTSVTGITGAVGTLKALADTYFRSK